MESSQVYMLISVVVLAIVAVLVFLVRNDTKANRLTPLTSTAFAFVIAGIQGCGVLPDRGGDRARSRRHVAQGPTFMRSSHSRGVSIVGSRMDVSSSNFPRYDRNSNTGGTIAEESEADFWIPDPVRPLPSRPRNLEGVCG